MRAVITGATGGIGGATAEALGRAGYEVIITGIDLEAGKKVLDKLESQGIKVHFYACDATNEEQVNETFAKIGEEFGSLDLLVNNVGGLGGRQRVSEMETGFMRKVMALNFDSAYAVIKLNDLGLHLFTNLYFCGQIHVAVVAVFVTGDNSLGLITCNTQYYLIFADFDDLTGDYLSCTYWFG